LAVGDKRRERARMRWLRFRWWWWVGAGQGFLPIFHKWRDLINAVVAPSSNRLPHPSKGCAPLPMGSPVTQPSRVETARWACVGEGGVGGYLPRAGRQKPLRACLSFHVAHRAPESSSSPFGLSLRRRVCSSNPGFSSIARQYCKNTHRHHRCRRRFF